MGCPNTASADRDLIEAVVLEMSAGIDRAVSFWMNQIEDVLSDSRLTTLGRLQAVKDVLGQYHHRHAGHFENGHGNVA